MLTVEHIEQRCKELAEAAEALARAGVQPTSFAYKALQQALTEEGRRLDMVRQAGQHLRRVIQ